MLDQSFNAAKNIVDFYISKLSEDITNPNAVFAMQWSQLKLLRLRTNASLNTLESYELESK
jgi:hypothetical protein